MIAEESTWGSFAYAQEAMNDASVAAQVGILAAHNYDQRDPSAPPGFSHFTSNTCVFCRVPGSLRIASEVAEPGQTQRNAGLVVVRCQDANLGRDRGIVAWLLARARTRPTRTLRQS